MGRNRFVNNNPSTRETVKVELSDGDYVLFKRELTNKELRHVAMAGFGSVKGELGANTELAINWEELEAERMFTYLHGWSFTDASGNPVQFNRANLDRLDEGTYLEIKTKLDEFVGEKEKEKNSELSEPSSRLKRVGAGSTSGKSQ